jgi:hypothetical protein
MEDKLTYEERKAKTIELKKKVYAEFQAKLKAEVLNTYGFEVYICDPESEKINTDRDMFSSAYVYLKDNIFGDIRPIFENSYKFNSDNEITGMGLSFRNEALGSINYHNVEKGLDEIKINREHKNLQSCLDELERLRQEIVKFYSI